MGDIVPQISTGDIGSTKTVSPTNVGGSIISGGAFNLPPDFFNAPSGNPSEGLTLLPTGSQVNYLPWVFGGAVFVLAAIYFLRR